MRPALGDRVAFTAILLKDKQWGGRVRWYEFATNGAGYYMGSRVVYEGKHDRGGYGDDPPYLTPERGVSHAIVVVSERAKPVRVPWSAIVAPPEKERP